MRSKAAAPTAVSSNDRFLGQTMKQRSCRGGSLPGVILGEDGRWANGVETAQLQEGQARNGVVSLLSSLALFEVAQFLSPRRGSYISARGIAPGKGPKDVISPERERCEAFLDTRLRLCFPESPCFASSAIAATHDTTPQQNRKNPEEKCFTALPERAVHLAGMIRLLGPFRARGPIAIPTQGVALG